MEKFIPLQETNAGKTARCNKNACADCRNKQEIIQQTIANQAGENNVNILQLYYAALIQCYSSDIRKGNQDNGYLHCT
ncbi:MAG: hypothetical protein ABI675_06495 [Chitinophagaceae bacterium]